VSQQLLEQAENQEERSWVIYGLVDPRTGEVRYVGFTVKGIDRLKDHLYRARTGQEKTYKANWIRSLLADGHVPGWVELEIGSGPGWRDAEIRWVAYYRSLMGGRLTNITGGGEGALGRKATPEQLEKMAEAGRRNAHRLIPMLAELNRGRKQSPESIAKKVKACMGQKRSDAFKAAMSERFKGKPKSPCHVDKIRDLVRSRIPVASEIMHGNPQAIASWAIKH